MNIKPPIPVVINTRTVSQIDGYHGKLIGTANGMCNVVVETFHSPMLFHEDELIQVELPR